MAILTGTGNKSSNSTTLEFSPISPSLDGPRDAYLVQVQQEGYIAARSVYNVHGWQLGHYYVYETASVFIKVKELARVEFDFSTSIYPDNADLKAEPILRLGIDWLSLFLGIEKSEPEDHSAEVVLEIYMRVNAEENPGEPEMFRRFWLGTSLEDAEKFGKELYAECVAAEERRKELGIPAREE